MMNGTDNDNSQFEECTDLSDCVEISFTSGLYLKPVAKLIITVTVPVLKSGQTISNSEVIEKLKVAIKPEKFTSIKAKDELGSKFLRFDAEVENRSNLDFIIAKIDQKGIRVGTLNDILKIRASEGKSNAPLKHEWNNFFKEAKHMNEKKPGERPDTVYIQGLPCGWFTHFDNPTSAEPSEYVLGKVFEKFGEIRAIDIPALDPYRRQMSQTISGLSRFSHLNKHKFEAYIQFKEYLGFVKCMTALHNMNLVLHKDEKAFYCSMKVDFDKSKHLSDASIKRREVEREKLMKQDNDFLKQNKIKMDVNNMKKEAALMEKFDAQQKQKKKLEEKELKKKLKEEKKKEKEFKKRLKKLISKNPDLKDIDDVDKKLKDKIQEEERKVVVAQRHVEAVRLFDKIFDRIKVYQQKEHIIKAAQPNSNKTLAEYATGWFERRCEKVYVKKQTILQKFAGFQSKDMHFLYKECDRKLQKIVHDQKMKFLKTCIKMAASNGKNVKEENDGKKKELSQCKRQIKSTKAMYLEDFQQKSNRLEKVLKGKIQVIILPIDDDNKVALSPASTDSSSSDSDSLSSSDDEKKIPTGKMRSDQILEGAEKYQNQTFFENHLHYFNQNYRHRGGHHMNNMHGQNGPNDFRGRGRFFRPHYNHNFRGNFDPNNPNNRGRGMFRRGNRGFHNKGRGDYYVYKKVFNHPIQEGEEKWFKRFDENEGGDNRDDRRSDSRSRSRSRSRSKRRSRSRSRSKRSRSRRSRSWSSRSRSRSRSKSRSKRRSRSWSSRSRSRSKSRGRRSSSRSRSRSKSRDRKYKGSKNSYSKSNRDSRYSDVEFSSGEEYNNHYETGYNKPNNYFSHNRGNRRPFFHRGNQRGRMYRGNFRGRGRGNFHNNNYEKFDHGKYNEPYEEDYVHMYKKYFNRVTEKDKYRGESSEYSDDDYDREKHRRRDSYRDSDSEVGNKRNRRYSNSSAEYSNKKRQKRSESSSEPEERDRRKRSYSPRKSTGSARRESDSDETDYNKQREKDLRERLSKKLQAKKSVEGKKSDSRKLNSKTPEGKKNAGENKNAPTSLKKRLSSVLLAKEDKEEHRKKDHSEMNARYREEEERQRMTKLKGQKPKEMKRQIRKRVTDSDDSITNISDSDDNYGPSPPKHLGKKLLRRS